MSTAETVFAKLEIPEVDWLQGLESNTMIIVDLLRGVVESLTARMGYRPVPFTMVGWAYTQCQSGQIRKALFTGADEYGYDISPDAPPVFMLDSNRMAGSGNSRAYDNRWCVFPQDMPSASFLLKAGIRRIIVRSEKIQNDLAHILLRYQKEGIEIYLCPDREIKKISVVRPSRFKSLSYRFSVILGLTRNGAGGFGAKIPEPVDSSYSSGGRYYGFG